MTLHRAPNYTSHGPTYIESKGICIYCGASGVELSDEHIVPYAIGGQHVIREASCQKCAKITARFEQEVMRNMWGDARVAFDAPSRRKSQRNSLIEMIDPNNSGRALTVPASEYPAGFLFYGMQQAGLLQGLPEDADISGNWRLLIVDDDSRRDNFLSKYPEKKLVLAFWHRPYDFGRLLAKIGYGQVMTLLDPGDINPICVPYILGHKTNVSYVVGGTEESQPSAGNVGYWLRTVGFGDSNRLMLMAQVRLIANTHTPDYHVIVGDVTGGGRIGRVMQKLGNMEISEFNSAQAAPGDPLDHWVPSNASTVLGNRS